MRPVPKDVPLIMYPAQAYTVPEPYGTVLVLGAWSLPVATTLNGVIGAVAAGNCVLVKPSEVSPSTSSVIQELLNTANLRTVTCIEGGACVARALLEEEWGLICFTGSYEKGQSVAAAAVRHLTPVILELGGKNPLILDEDADIELTVDRVVQGCFLNSGQTCVSPEIVLVSNNMKEEFVGMLISRVQKFFGDPRESQDYGRIVSEAHTERIAQLLEGHGGQVVLGGEYDINDRYVAPTVIVNPDLSARIAQEEVFGPVLLVLTYASIDECVQFINERPKPLVLYYFGNNKRNLMKIEQCTSSGALVCNEVGLHYGFPDLPFGGVGPSGASVVFGKEGFLAMSHNKSVVRASSLNRGPYQLRYPPFTEDKIRKLLFMTKYLSGPTHLKLKVLKIVVFLLILSFAVKRGLLSWLLKSISYINT